MKELNQIAKDAAKTKAEEYYTQEQHRSPALAFSYVVTVVVSAIGLALFEAGHKWDGISLTEKQAIATDALVAVGYQQLPNDNK
jgi:hypothetical protein